MCVRACARACVCVCVCVCLFRTWVWFGVSWHDSNDGLDKDVLTFCSLSFAIAFPSALPFISFIVIMRYFISFIVIMRYSILFIVIIHLHMGEARGREDGVKVEAVGGDGRKRYWWSKLMEVMLMVGEIVGTVRSES